MSRVGAGDHCLSRDAAGIYASATEAITFDDGNGLARSGKPRGQWRTGLARPNNDGVEMLRYFQSGPSI
jgi:hypothetical protein